MEPGASLIAQMVKNLPEMQETPVRFLGRKIPWRRDRLPTPGFLGFPCGSTDKESTCNVGDLGSIPGLESSPGKGKGYSLQDSSLENSTDCIVHGIVKSWTQLSLMEPWNRGIVKCQSLKKKNKHSFPFYHLFWPCQTACRILVPGNWTHAPCIGNMES